jgi:hypothetical protein
MVIQATGAISLASLKTEFGGVAGTRVALSDYYQNASTQYAPTVDGVPNIGSQISFAVFRGKAKTANLSNLVCFLDAKNTNSYPGTGVTWTDLSASANNVTLNSCGYSSTAGGGAITFNGTSSYAYKSTFTGFTSSNFTVIMWLYVTGNFATTFSTGTGFGGCVFMLGRSSTDSDTEIGVYLNGLWDYQAGYGFNFSKATTSISTTNWYQVAFVKSGTSGAFYLNGSANGTVTAAKNAAYSANDFCIGKDFRDNIVFYMGYIGLYMIYNYSMTSTEIATNFSNYRGRYGI